LFFLFESKTLKQT